MPLRFFRTDSQYTGYRTDTDPVEVFAPPKPKVTIVYTGIPGPNRIGDATVVSDLTPATAPDFLIVSQGNRPRALPFSPSGTRYLHESGEWRDVPTGDGGFEAENKDVAPLAAGSPVSVNGGGVVAGGRFGLQAHGFARSLTAVGFAAVVQVGGILTLSDWSAVLDTAGVTLAQGATYFLSPLVGKITATRPTASGQWSQRLGVAMTPQTLAVEISEPYLM